MVQKSIVLVVVDVLFHAIRFFTKSDFCQNTLVTYVNMLQTNFGSASASGSMTLATKLVTHFTIS